MEREKYMHAVSSIKLRSLPVCGCVADEIMAATDTDIRSL